MEFQFTMFPLILFLFLGVLPTAISRPQVDPECDMNPVQIAARYGYNMERHYVVTDDGYILLVHHIPPKTPKAPVVFLQHGLLDSSATWVLNGKKGSFAFILSDSGFDVWMGNVRGNTYTKNHTTIPADSDKFWDFTFDEMSSIDLPNMIDHVLNSTGQESLFYFGHSQGNLIGFTGFTRNPDLAKKIKLFTALAPVSRVTYVQGLFHYLSRFQSSMEWYFKEFGVRQFLPSDWFMKLFAGVLCPLADKGVCSNIMFIMAGYNSSNLNASRVDIYESHSPADTSTKNVLHWAQMVKDKKLQMYDYESVAKNMQHYGSPNPPEYNITGLSIPTVLVMGGNDWLGDPRDELWLIQQIGHTVIKYFTIDYYNHLDFIWGIDAPEVVYYPMIDIMKSML